MGLAGTSTTLPTGAEVRLSGVEGPLAVVCANGARRRRCPELGVRRSSGSCAGSRPGFGPAIRRGAVPRQVLEPPRPLRRRRAGRDRREPRAAGAPDGFLHGWRRPRGRPPRVVGVLGLAPWLPDELDLAPLRGRRLDVLHGALDRWLPGIPGVSPALTTWLRAGAGARRRRLVHPYPARRARGRAPVSVGSSPLASSCELE